MDIGALPYLNMSGCGLDTYNTPANPGDLAYIEHLLGELIRYQRT